jgi:hypothetical protein
MAHRFARPLAAAILALGLASAAAAAAAAKLIDASKLFTHYDAYLKLPAGERSHFIMAFYLKSAGQPMSAPLFLVEGATRTPIPMRADGKVLKLPTLAQLDKAKVDLGVEEGTKIGETLGLEPVVAPAVDLDAHELAAAIAQAGPGMKKIAGILAMALPTPKAVLFVGAPSGEAELADGKRVPLPMVKGSPAYDPAAIPNARRIHLPSVPRKLDID